jgi:hypothetical protein
MGAKRTSKPFTTTSRAAPFGRVPARETGLDKHPERTLVQIGEQSNRIRMTLLAFSIAELLE